MPLRGPVARPVSTNRLLDPESMISNVFGSASSARMNAIAGPSGTTSEYQLPSRSEEYDI